MPCTCPFSSSSTRSLTSPSMSALRLPPDTESARTRRCRFRHLLDVQLGDRLVRGWAAAAAPPAAALPGVARLDGSIMVVLPTAPRSTSRPRWSTTWSRRRWAWAALSAAPAAAWLRRRRRRRRRLDLFGITLGRRRHLDLLRRRRRRHAMAHLHLHPTPAGRGGRAGTCRSPYAMPACKATAATTATRSGLGERHLPRRTLELADSGRCSTRIVHSQRFYQVDDVDDLAVRDAADWRRRSPAALVLRQARDHRLDRRSSVLVPLA